MHVEPQRPPLHVAVAFAGTEHTRVHDPQCVGFVVVSTQEKLQSVGAVGAQTTPQAWDAPAVTQIGAGSLQIVPQRPQSVAEDRSDSQPSAAIALQWVN